MNKKILMGIGIMVMIIALLGVYVIHIHKPVPTEEQLSEEFSKFKTQYQEKKAQGHDVTEAEGFARKAKQAFDGKDYKRAKEFLDDAFEALEKAEIPEVPIQLSLIPKKYKRPQVWKENAVLYKHVDLRPFSNVDSNNRVGYLYVGDLNGDGKVDFLYNVGLQYARAFDHDGNFMWEIKSPYIDAVRGTGIRDAYHPKLAAIFDIDNDGENEVIIPTLTEGSLKKDRLMIVNGKDGKIEKSVELPFDGHRGVIAVGYLRGGSTPEIAISGSPSCNGVAVYDSDLNLLWWKDFGKEKLGHYMWFCDIDGDGKQELFVGKRLFDENGNEIWNMKEFVETGDHVDSLSCGDLDPEIPGKEVIACGAIGVVCYDKNGNTLWSRIKDPDIKNPQTVMLGEFDKNNPGLEIRVQKKPPNYGKGMYPLSTEEWLLDKDGNILFHADLPNWQGRWQIDWDGDRNQDEILLQYGGVAQWKGKTFEVVSNGPFGLEDSSEFELVDPRFTPRSTSYDYVFMAFPMDVAGDPREEIIFYDDDEIIIVQNGAPFSGNILSFRNDTSYKLRYVNRDYHTNAPIFFDYQKAEIPEVPIPTCGNSICESGENGHNCPSDCCVSGDGKCPVGCTSENDGDCEETKDFVTVCGNNFCLNGERFRFVGANKASLPAHTHQEIDDIFEEASKLGIKVMRVFVHDPLNIPNYTFENFDYMLNSAKRHKIRLIITLANNDRDPILYMLRAHPDLGDYEKIIKDREKTEEIRKSFFEDEEANELYRDFVYKMVTRTNSINGIQYREDSTIFSWELMNEPAYAVPSIGILVNWIEKTSSYIRSIDQNHMISIGGEGNTKYYLTNQGENYFVKVHQIATNISFCTFHIYGRPTLNEDDFEKVLDGLIQDAHETLNKPVVMEEYGISKRKCNHTWTREGFYQFMLDEFYSKGGDGTLFWGFTIRRDLTKDEIEKKNILSLHPDDAELREIIKEKAEEIGGN